MDEGALADGLGTLVDAASWAPGAIAEIESLIRTGSDLALFRINPIRFASSRSLDESESIDLFLHATKAGLFLMSWDILCGSCGSVFKSFRKLEKVDPHFRCDICNMDNVASLDEFIQVTFTVSPRIRDIVLHHPDQLTIEQLLYEFRFTQDARVQFDDLTLTDLMREWTEALLYLEPGEKIVLEVDLTEGGGYALRDIAMSTSMAFFVRPDRPAEDTFATVVLDEDGFSPQNLRTSEFSLPTPIGTNVFPLAHFIVPGVLSVSCENVTKRRIPLWASKYSSDVSVYSRRIDFEPFLSAKQLLNTQSFRKLFRAETPPEGEGLSVLDLTYLFTDLTDSTAMYDEVGDLTAYNLVRAHFDALGEVVAENHGAVVKTVGDAIMATFIRPVDAVTSAMAMLEALAEFNASMSSGLSVKIGIHRGHSIAVTINERLDYFGQNVNIAARTQQRAGAGEILISQDVLDDPAVANLLVDTRLEATSGVMKGVAEEIPVFRVSAADEGS